MLIVVEEGIEHVVSTILGWQKIQHLFAEGVNLQDRERESWNVDKFVGRGGSSLDTYIGLFVSLEESNTKSEERWQHGIQVGCMD